MRTVGFNYFITDVIKQLHNNSTSLIKIMCYEYAVYLLNNILIAARQIIDILKSMLIIKEITYLESY